MARVEESLALAASSNNYSRERRLTEIFGCVLEQHVGLVNVVLEKLALPHVDHPQVWSQEDLGQAGDVDFILRGSSASGSRAVVYFEHKEPKGAWQEGQPWKYLDVLQREVDQESRWQAARHCWGTQDRPWTGQ